MLRIDIIYITTWNIEEKLSRDSRTCKSGYETFKLER